MKQPELGKKISELRKAKGITQEELVEKCNVSVRTIQRIESGDVTPRSYTVKTILAALDYDFAKISYEDEKISKPFSAWLKDLLLIDVNLNEPSDFLLRQLNLAWIFGIIYFVLGFAEGAAEYFRYMENEIIFSSMSYALVKTAVLVSYLFFQRGIIMIAGLFNNYLLKILSVMLIVGNIMLTGYDIASVFYDSTERGFVMGGAALSFGAMGIIYGVSLRRLDKAVGRVAELAGITEIIVGCFFLTIVLSFVGFIFMIPAELFEIIMIFKTIEIIRARATQLAV